ncbi:MAG: DUF4838 domain-containing protein [Bacteroidia bacterium]|nr:MAG: DUF4838 domain-containing protein [Bacteroidia bacterium]
MNYKLFLRTVAVLLMGTILSATCQRVSENQSFLASEDRESIIYLEDAGSELLHMLDKDEKEHYLVENGIPKAQIIISPSASSTVYIAAKELQTAIRKMTGEVLPVRTTVDDSIFFKVYVGRSRNTDELGITSEGCRDGGFKMVSGDDYLVLIGDDKEYTVLGPHSTSRAQRDSPALYKKWYDLTGATWNNYYIHSIFRRYDPEWDLWEGDGRGSFNAVHEFLYEQGARWYYPGDIGEIIPTKRSIRFDSVCKTVNPDFKLRDFYIYYMGFSGSDDDEILWQFRLRTNAQESYMAYPPEHGITPVIDNDYMKINHPEYYTVWNSRGGRQNGDEPKPDLCSEGLYQENLAYIKAIIDIYDETIISAMPSDGYNWISDESDEECAAWDSYYPRNYYGRLSDYVWEYVNNLAWDIYNEYGLERKVSCSIYPAYKNVPTKLTKPPAPNLVATFTYSRSDLEDEKYKEEQRALFEDWFEFLTSKEVYIGTFYLDNTVGRESESIPSIYPHIIAEDLRYFKGKSQGEDIEVLSSAYDDWDRGYDIYAGNSLNTYITARLYWDVNQDVDALLEEYYTLFYGPASQEMKQFHEYVEAIYNDAPGNSRITGTMRRLLGEARTTAGNSIYGKRIDLLIGLMDHKVD